MARSIDIQRENANQGALDAELQVDLTKKVSAVSMMQNSKKAAIVNAYYDCISENNIDVVVDPIIKITRFPSFSLKQYKAEIEGFGGKYIKIENAFENIKKFDSIDINSIVKYKLMTEPDFYKSYYNSQKTSNVLINTEAQTQPASTGGLLRNQSMQLSTLQPSDQSLLHFEMLHKDKAIMNTGIAFCTIGIATMIPIGVPLLLFVGDPYISIGIGAGLTAIGIGCLIGGYTKIKTAKKEMALSYGISPNGAGLTLNF